MTSFIIISRDKEKRISFAKEFCAKRDINPFDISIIEKDNTVKQNVNSIGIDDVKKLQRTIFLTPLKSNFKAVVLEDAQLLTTEAQNALLKVLEEPPEHTLMLLGADAKESLLPTILSRCQIITLETEATELTTRERNSIAQFISELPEMSIGERLKKAELLAKDKDKAIDWVEKVIIVLRDKLLSNVILAESRISNDLDLNVTTVRDSGPASQRGEQARMSNYLTNLQSLHNLLKTTNVNPRFAIENTLLNL